MTGRPERARSRPVFHVQFKVVNVPGGSLSDECLKKISVRASYDQKSRTVFYQRTRVEARNSNDPVYPCTRSLCKLSRVATYGILKRRSPTPAQMPDVTPERYANHLRPPEEKNSRGRTTSLFCALAARAFLTWQRSLTQP